jgi:prophage regulatory protein
MSEVDIESLQVLRPAQVYKLVGLSASRIRQLEAAGEFPRRFNLGSHATAWRAVDIQTWLASRIEAGRTGKRSTVRRSAVKRG